MTRTRVSRAWARAFTSALIVLTAAVCEAAATDHCGAVCDETWTAADNPHIVTCDVTVADVCSLVVEQGVDVRFELGTGLIVDGAFQVNGAAASRATFVSNAAIPHAGDWIGLKLQGNASAIVRYASVLDAVSGVWTGGAAHVELDHVLANANINGVVVRGDGAPQVKVIDSELRLNAQYGVHIFTLGPGMSVDVSRSWIEGNAGGAQFVAESEFAVFPEADQELFRARGNWWGSTDPLVIASGIRDRRYFNVWPTVDWCGFLDGPGGSPVNFGCPDLRVDSGQVEVLDLTDRPYLLTSWLMVEAGGTLQIAAGVELRVIPTPPDGAPPEFSGFVAVESMGRLEIAGTAEAPVTVTGVGTPTEFPYWSGFIVGDPGSATITYATIEGAFHAVAVVGTIGAWATLDHVTGRLGKDGLSVGPGTVTATDCTFTDNVRSGVLASGAAAGLPETRVTVRRSSIHSNAVYDFLLWANPDYPALHADARQNWWGTTDEALIRAHISDGEDEPGYPVLVDWCDYLDAADGRPVPSACPPEEVCDETVVWDWKNWPYDIPSGVHVCPTGTLRIEPGVTARVWAEDPPLEIRVEGMLEVAGTADSRVTLESNAAVPMPEDWKGVILTAGATATIEHADIRHGDIGVHVFDGSSATLNDVTLRRNRDGLYIYGTQTPSVTATGSRFVQNSRYGIYVQGVPMFPDPALTVSNSEIWGNDGIYDVYLDGGFSTPATTVFQGEYNWWSTTNLGVISARIHDREDDPANAVFDPCPFLASAGGPPSSAGCVDLGICDEAVVWDRTDQPYVITGDLTICPTGSLEIRPGVQVLFVRRTPPIRFVIQGTLGVLGSEAAPVRFQPDAAEPIAGEWAGLEFTGTLNSLIQHADIAYGTYGVRVGEAGSIELRNVSLSHSQYDGLYLYGRPAATLMAVTSTGNGRHGLNIYAYGSGPALQMHATHSSFTDNAAIGVVDQFYYGPDAVVSITASAIHGNAGAYDFQASGSAAGDRTVVTATGNWWGTTDGVQIANRIFDYSDSNYSPIVDRCGYLDGPGGALVHDGHCPDAAVCDETVVWDLTDKPYYMEQVVSVCPTGTLQVGPGVRVNASQGDPVRLLVQGRLEVNGIAEQPVQFTSARATPARGDWYGVGVVAGGTAEIDEATISYATFGIQAGETGALMLNGVTLTENLNDGLHLHGRPSATLDHVACSSNGRHGLYVYAYGSGPALSVQATNSAFTGNGAFGVYDQFYYGPDAQVSVTGSALHGNAGAFDFHTSGSAAADRTVVTATGNWWGTTDGVQIANRIFDYSDANYSPIVDRCGYLDGPGGAAVHNGHCPDAAVCDETVTWDLTDAPYYMEQVVIVCPTGTLQVGPGVQVHAAQGDPVRLIVAGRLDIDGTAGAPVLFTPEAAAPTRGAWYGLVVPGGVAEIDETTIEYAQYGISAGETGTLSLNGVTLTQSLNDGLLLYGRAAATLDRVTASTNGRHGLYVYAYGSGPALSVQATNSAFTGNGSYGVYDQRYYGPDAQVSITGSALHGNAGAYDLNASGAEYADRAVVTATGNWWGATDAVQIANRIFDYSDSDYSPIVDRCGYLDGPGGAAVHDGHCPDPAICGETAVWNLTDLPYYLEQIAIVCPTGRLEIGPGVEVRAAGGAPTKLSVRGELSVEGATAQPALLTSAGAPGDWSGLEVIAGGAAELREATVRHGSYGVRAGESATLTFDGVTVRDNQNDGLYLYGAPVATLKRVTAQNNGRYGVHLYSYGSGAPASLNATDCRFVENTSTGVRLLHYYGPDAQVTIIGSAVRANGGPYDLEASGALDPAHIVWAPDVWWGTSDRVQARARIYDHDDSAWNPAVVIDPFGVACDRALGGDADGDGWGDVEDNCPALASASQADADGDRMGDACDPDPDAAPLIACDGFQDVDDGYLDGDADGWGDPCDAQPTRADSHPGAAEICDGRDNDGDATLEALADGDGDLNLACADCNDGSPTVHTCACEACANTLDDDCDLAVDAADADCASVPTCVVLLPGPAPDLQVYKGACAGAAISGPFDVIRGHGAQLRFDAGHVDLGEVSCVAGDLPWDRVTDVSENPNPRCERLHFFLGKNASDPDYGAASSGERRDTMTPDPACP